MKKEMTREEMIALIKSDYGFGPEITGRLTTETLKDVCNSNTPYLYLKNLLELVEPKKFLK